MRSPVKLVFLALLIASASAAAQEPTNATPAAATPGNAPAPAEAQARAPATPASATPVPAKPAAGKSRNFFGQAIAELTRSVEASRTPAATPAAKSMTQAAPSVPPPRDTQVAAQDD